MVLIQLFKKLSLGRLQVWWEYHKYDATSKGATNYLHLAQEVIKKTANFMAKSKKNKP
jgi:hypothetical protein